MKKASQHTGDLKRKAAEAHEKTRSHPERCRRITSEHTRSEATVNHSLGSLGWCVKETAAATHSLTCDVSDHESNEIRYPFTHCPLVSHCQQSPRILCTRCFVPWILDHGVLLIISVSGDKILNSYVLLDTSLHHSFQSVIIRS